MKKKGLTLIELLIAVSIVGILILAALLAYRLQLMKGRDARRKADLAKLQRVLEDYLNDNVCYPESLECGQDFSPYLSSVPCDPLNVGANIYYYSVAQEGECKKWYKIFTRLENEKDPAIKKIGCTVESCGPFNYLVSSPNVEVLVQQPGESYPPAPPGVPIPTSTPAPTPSPSVSPTPTPSVTPTPTLPPGTTPTPTPTCDIGWFTCVDQGGKCNYIGSWQPGAVCDSTCNECTASGCSPDCLVQGAKEIIND